MGKERDYADHDPEDFSIGFWTGASVATIVCSVVALLGLYFIVVT